MVILGIDPGFAIVGYGAIRYERGKFQTMGHGAILTKSKLPFSLRLVRIFDDMNTIISKCHPDVMSIERLYFQSNQKTAINVAQARGVVLLAAEKCGVPIFEYTPLQVKLALTGYGKAPKFQIMQMVKKILNLPDLPKYDDTADALALAVCHAQTSALQSRLKDIHPLK